MTEIDISKLEVGEVRSLVEAVEELGVSKGRLAQYIRNDQIDYGMRGNVKLIPESEIERRRRENPGPGNPNFGKGYSRMRKAEAFF